MTLRSLVGIVFALAVLTGATAARIVTTSAEGRTATLIMDYKKATMTILMPAQHMYLVRPLTMPGAPGGPSATSLGAAPNPAAAPALTKEGPAETILGYLCNKYVTHANGNTTEIWATDELGSFSAFGRGNLGGPRADRGALPPGWDKALAGQNFFPMRVVGKDANGTEKFRMEVTAVTKEKLPDEDFVPPAGFQEFDMRKMMAH